VKILFLCPSLEAGRDGVGDYTARLVRELHGRGHECFCIAINDRHVAPSCTAISQFYSTIQAQPVVRLSSQQTWCRRSRTIQQLASDFGPDWVSLQYVPWGFESRGLHLGLGANLSPIVRRPRLHVMCHELWMEGSLFKLNNRILGALQKRFVARLFRVLKPRVVHTHTPLYRKMLRDIKVRSDLLPIHGNIPVSSTRAEGRSWLKEQTGCSGRGLFFGFFGEIHSSLNLDVLAALARDCANRAVEVCVLSAGHLTPAGMEAWYRVTSILGGTAMCKHLGRMGVTDVSKFLSGLDEGLSSYPPEFAGKSGGVAAMLEHGLAVRLLGHSACRSGQFSGCLVPKDGSSVSLTAERMLSALTS
jgi:hypothetical protein